MNCPFCNGELKNRKIEYELNNDNKEIKLVNINAKTCTNCGEFYVDTETAIKIERELMDNSLKMTVYR